MFKYLKQNKNTTIKFSSELKIESLPAWIQQIKLIYYGVLKYSSKTIWKKQFSSEVRQEKHDILFW